MLDKGFPELNSKNTFVKYGVHNLGEQRLKPDSSPKSSLVILISGGIELKFYESDRTTINKITLLKNKGDMAYYGPGVNHAWKVKENNTLVLTIQYEASTKTSLTEGQGRGST